MNQKLPVAKAILSEWTVEADGFSWNDRYQAAVESVIAMQRRAAAADEAAGPAVDEPVGPLLSSYFSYFATYGSFLDAARKGVTLSIFSL
jgi:hypothetical protein